MNRARERSCPLLTWKDGAGALQILPLETAQRYSIGRLPRMSVVLAWDPRVSKLHAEVVCVDGAWVLADNGLSHNGTYVNGQRVHERTRLRDGDRVTVGNCVLAFHDEPLDDVIETTVADDGSPVPEFDDPDIAILVEFCRDYLQHRIPAPVANKVIASAAYMSEETVAKRLGKMYKRCGIDSGRDTCRAELMQFVVDHGVVGMRHYAAPNR